MAGWVTEKTEQFNRDLKWYSKKHPNELEAVINNLQSYLDLLNECEDHIQINAGFLHKEPAGIKAIDQKGAKETNKPKQTRLYVYSIYKNKVLYLLAIGDKKTQSDDIKKCIDYVKRLKGGK